tara:strand:+ start:23341 stop:25224 length:1884 start_codon:yes stop_codon:yes gene_type:complete
MFIVHVAPIQKRAMDRLTYFSAEDLPIGSVVTIPLRKKEVPALVLATEDAQSIKAVLRSNIFEMKKLPKQKARALFLPSFLRALDTTAQHFVASRGALLERYAPTAIVAAAQRGGVCSPSETNNATTFKQHVLQLSLTERIEKYKTLIRSNFAHGNSVFVCVPTIHRAQFLGEQCSRGIEQYTFILESSQTKKKQVETWNAILRERHPVVVIATPAFLSIPRGDVSLFILEQEMASSYKQHSVPFSDARTLVKALAREIPASILYAGTTVSTRVHKEMHDGFATALEEHARKLRTTSSVQIIDAKKSRAQADREFPVLTNESLQLLASCTKERGNIFVFAARRGIATQTVCNDCSLPVKCPSCKSSLVLHEQRGIRELLCHRCGIAQDAHTRCVHCDSWNLVPLGIGIERIEAYVKKHLPDTPLFVITSDRTKTPKQALEVVTKFYQTPGSILIGTEMALSHLTLPISCSVVSSIDSLLCIPDFGIEEKIFGIIATLRERTNRILLIETANIQNAMLEYATTGALSEYADTELRLRKKLRYPPYVTLIQVACIGTRAKVIDDMQSFVEITKKYTPRVFSGFIPRGRHVELRALIKISTEQWPDSELVGILHSLPHSFTITVDPERML